MEEPRGEQKLLAAIISHALADASAPPVKRLGKDGNVSLLSRDTSTALDFLFDEGSMLEVYLQLLDIDAGMFRRNLLEHMYSNPPQKLGELSDTKVRNIRINYEMLKRIKKNHLEKDPA